MNVFQLFLVLALSSSHFVYAKSTGGSGGSHAVKGHVKKDGTYVQPHRATNPNGTQKDNWTSKPNVNTYTGKQGTKEAEK